MRKRLTKRALFRGQLDQREAIRPPGAAEDFYSRCDQCGACAPACPRGIIHIDGAGFPNADPARASCLFCGACADACATGALNPSIKWNVRARVSASCLSFNGVTCRACEDQCDEQAIRFRPMTAGRSLPDFDLERCTGCGACSKPCPAHAISFFEHTQPNGESPC